MTRRQPRACPGGCGTELGGMGNARRVACERCWFRVPWRLRERYLRETGDISVRRATVVGERRRALEAIEDWWRANPAPVAVAEPHVPAWELNRRES